MEYRSQKNGPRENWLNYQKLSRGVFDCVEISYRYADAFWVPGGHRIGKINFWSNSRRQMASKIGSGEITFISLKFGSWVHYWSAEAVEWSKST